MNSYNSSNHREVPDIAADADPLTSAQVVISGQLTQAGGTSQAAPIWAGMMAVIDSYLRHNRRPVAGFLNPALYRLAAGKPAYPPFHDVTVGDNLVYPATPGYDLASGLGTPDAWNLARDLAAHEGGTK
jgi:kumamolisin